MPDESGMKSDESNAEQAIALLKGGKNHKDVPILRQWISFSGMKRKQAGKEKSEFSKEASKH